MDYEQLQAILRAKAHRPGEPWATWVRGCEPDPGDTYWEGVRQQLKERWAAREFFSITQFLLEQLPEPPMRDLALLLAVRLLLDETDGLELDITDWTVPFLEKLEEDIFNETDFAEWGRRPTIQVNQDVARRQPEFWLEYLTRYHPNADLTDLDVLQNLEDHQQQEFEYTLVPGRGALLTIQGALEEINNPGWSDLETLARTVYGLAYSYGVIVAKRQAFGAAHPPHGLFWEFFRDDYIKKFIINWWKLVVCKFPWVQNKLVLYHGMPSSLLEPIVKEGLNPRVHLGQLPLAYYYAAATAFNVREDRGVVLKIEIPLNAVPGLEFQADTISLLEPVGFYDIDRQESLDQLDQLGLLTEALEKEADFADQIVEERADIEEVLWPYLEKIRWPEAGEWERTLVLVGSVVTEEAIPPEWISVYDDDVEPSPLVPK